MVTHLPNHLQGERKLAEYFESMGLTVESVSICREVDSLKLLLDKRTAALLKLEAAWVRYVGNPSVAEIRNLTVRENQSPDDTDLEARSEAHVVPQRKRPTLRPGWFQKKVDALEYLGNVFREADEQVKKCRRMGRFKATHTAFVTFETMSSAVGHAHIQSQVENTHHYPAQQIAAQTVHGPIPSQCLTRLAPEPRDIVWSNITHSPASLRVRESIVLGAMGLLFFFWLIPTSALASLLSYKEIKKTMPWLGQLIDANEQVRAIVQNSLPSVAIITLNALLPFLLEGDLFVVFCTSLLSLNAHFVSLIALTYIQGYPARSLIEYSLLKK